MAQVNPNDDFLVNRDNATYTETQVNLMANLEPNDYLLVNRDDATYKITGQEFIDSVIDPLELVVVLDKTTPAPGEVINAIASPAGGKQPYTPITYQWKQRANDGQVTDISGATFSSLSITAEMAGFEIACEATVGDSLGNSVTTLSDYTDAVAYQEEVDTPELITPPDGAGLGVGIKPESGLITDVTVEGPTAEMHGLRFDRNRETRLSRTFTPGDTWTVSFWYKPTEPASSADYFALLANDGFNYIFNTRTDGFSINGTGGGYVFNYSWQLNQWVHIVIRQNSTEVEGYVNGVSVGSNAGAKFLNEEVQFIGYDVKAQSDGYLSDVYFVDGESLEPTVFGKDFGGVWGPLDSSDVKASIADSVEIPYDTRPNYDQEWSDTAAWSTDGSDASLFDGDLSQGALCEGVTSAQAFRTLTTGSFDVTSQIQIYSNISTGLTLTLRVNDSEEFVSDVSAAGENEYRTFNVSAAAGAITKLEVKYPGVTTGYRIYGVAVDGRLLIDGPANNSQVWSGSMSGTTESNEAYTRMFDGNTNDGLSAANTVDPIVWDIGQSNAIQGQVEVYLTSGAGTGWLTVNGQANSLDGSLRNWQTLTGVTELYSFQVTSPGGNTPNPTGRISAWRVGGKILIDAPAQWNTSQVWSETTTFSGTASYPITGPFDGNNQTRVRSGTNFNGQVQTLFTANPSVTATSGVTIELSGLRSVLNLIINKDLPDEASASLDLGNGDASARRFLTTPFVGEVVSAHVETVTTDGSGYSIWTVTVDDTFLVDGGSFGTNGFYLPFDPAATSKNYSQGTYSANPAAIGTRLFDGDTSTYFSSNTPNTSTVEVTFDPALNGKLEVFPSTNDNTRVYTVTHAGGTSNLNGPAGAADWLNFGELTNITKVVAGAGKNDYGGFMSAIRLDGKILVDSSSIGHDDSGNGNHFQDENFAAGNTSQVWSAGLSGTAFTNANYDGLPSRMFDGASNGFNAVWCRNNTLTLTLPAAMSGDLSFIIENGNATSSVQIDTDNGESFATTVGVTGVTYVTFAPTQSYTTLTFTPTDTGAIIYGLSVDGKLLIDGNIQDTVLDTPMRNYAVL